MADDIARAYDRAPYPDFAFWATHPGHLGMFGRLFGLACAPPERCRVLEIGCAVGGNIVPMAAALPASHFVGVDLSGVQIARAATASAEARLSNLTLIHGDFRDVPERLGPFDYIICHGVYAWVSPDTQRALLTFMRERLAPHGVAFVSYNAYPGQHTVDMVRKVVKVHTQGAPDLAAKARQAVAVMEFLTETSRTVEGMWHTGFLEIETKALERGGLDLLEHDYGAIESHPRYFVDFVADCEQAGLAYLADSDPFGMYLENQRADVIETLKPLDLVMRGQYLDFIRHTRYRETLVCRADAPLVRDVDHRRVMDLHIGQALSSEPNLDGIESALPVPIVVGKHPAFTVSSPIIRVALRRLWYCGRHAPHFDQLAAWVIEDLERLGALDADPPRVRERLAAQLLRAFFAGAVRLGLCAVDVPLTVPERPRTGIYQRWTAREKRPTITTLSHEVFEATDMMLALLPHLDGTRTHDELQALWPDQPIADALQELLRRGYLTSE